MIIAVIALACHPLWLSEAGLNAAGPSAFGWLIKHTIYYMKFLIVLSCSLDHEFQSVGKYCEPISVIEEYSIWNVGIGFVDSPRDREGHCTT